MRISVVAGAQFGSEAKGHVTHRVILQEQQAGYQVYNVRVGGPNAGHTVYAADGSKFAFRQVPVGGVVPGVIPVIAAGSEIDLPILLEEVGQRNWWAMANGVVLPPLLIDGEVTILTEDHKAAEAGASLTARLGSTGKGIGAARADRLMRTAERLVDDHDLINVIGDLNCEVVDTSLLQDLGRNTSVVIEGTQGYGLGLHAGYYPKCTAGDCTAIDFLAQARLAPFGHTVEPWIVARMFPIRVAGNSGPLQGETTWEALGLPPEYTTVTKKMRRVGEWDDTLFAEALRANGGGSVVRVAITMFDQKFKSSAGVTAKEDLPRIGMDWIENLEERHACKVDLITTGPTTGVWL